MVWMQGFGRDSPAQQLNRASQQESLQYQQWLPSVSLRHTVCVAGNINLYHLTPSENGSVRLKVP